MRNLWVTLRYGLLGWGLLWSSPTQVGADDTAFAESPLAESALAESSLTGSSLTGASLAGSSLSGTALLEDLGAELLEPSPVAPHKRDRRDSPSAAGDAPQLPPHQRMSEVIGHMHSAQTLLEQSDGSGIASSAQGAALSGLDAMIAELTQRQSLCQGGQQRGGKSDPPSQLKPGSNGSAGTSPAQAAPSATQSGAEGATARAATAATDRLVKDLWGQLPQRQREQILQPLGEEFLPKYASEIEAYFRALADPNRTTPGQQ